MENELMIVNNNELELTKDGIKFIKKVQKAKSTKQFNIQTCSRCDEYRQHKRKI